MGDAKEKVKKVYIYKSFIPRRIIHLALVVILVSVYAVFFTSNFWMPVSETIIETPIGTSYEFHNVILNLKSWKYNKDEEFMLVNIGIQNMNISNTISYNIAAIDNTLREVPLEVLYSDKTFFMIKIPKVKNREVIKLSVQVVEDSADAPKKNEGFSSFILSKKNIKIDNGLQNEYTSTECIALDMMNDVELYRSEQVKLEAEIRAKKILIENANIKIKEIEGNKHLLAGEEIENANGQVVSLAAAIETAEKDMHELQERLATNQKKEKEKTSIIDNYIKENNLDINLN